MVKNVPMTMVIVEGGLLQRRKVKTATCESSLHPSHVLIPGNLQLSLGSIRFSHHQKPIETLDVFITNLRLEVKIPNSLNLLI